MPGENECRFSVELEGIGRFENVTSWSIQQSYITPADGFDFVVTDPENPAKLREVFRPWQPVTLYVNDRIQLLGRIDATEGTGPGGVDLRCSGRDYFGSFVDANAPPQFRVTKGDTLGSFLLRLLAPFGVTTVTADGYEVLRNLRTGVECGASQAWFQQIPLSDLHPSDGQGTFQLVTSVLSRHRLTLQPTTKRSEVALVRPAYNGKPVYEIRQSASEQSLTNLLSSSASRDFTDVPTVTIARIREPGVVRTDAQKVAPPKEEPKPTGAPQTPVEKSLEELAAFLREEEASRPPVVSQRSVSREIPSVGASSPSGLGEVPEVSSVFASFAVQSQLPMGKQGNALRVYKPVYYKDDKARNKPQMYAGLCRELAERLQKTLMYSVEMDGIASADGTIYAVDMLATVNDDVQAVHETLWISEVDMGDDGSGPRTTLKMIRPGSFAL